MDEDRTNMATKYDSIVFSELTMALPQHLWTNLSRYVCDSPFSIPPWLKISTTRH